MQVFRSFNSAAGLSTTFRVNVRSATQRPRSGRYGLRECKAINRTSSLHTSAVSATVSQSPVAGTVDLGVTDASVATDASSGVLSAVLNAPIDGLQQLIEIAHISGGLPWWVSICGTALVLRGCFSFPLAMYQEKMFAKRELLAPELKNWEEALTYKWVDICRRRGDTPERFKEILGEELTAKRKEFYMRDGCHPWKSTASIWVALPLWVGYSIAVRRMCEESLTGTLSGFDSGGALWFSDLLLPDQYYVFPILLSMAHLTNMEIAGYRPGDAERELTTRQRAVRGAFRSATIAMFYISTQLPVAVGMYWTVSGFYRVGENLYLKQPRVRRFFNIPPTPSDSATPARDIAKNALKKFQRANKPAPVAIATDDLVEGTVDTTDSQSGKKKSAQR